MSIPDKAARAAKLVARRMADGGPVNYLPHSDSLAVPDAPTPNVMAQHGRVENVPLSQARATQSNKYHDKGGYPGELVKGYADKPVAGRKENGEYLVFDGHHRTVSAIKSGPNPYAYACG